VAQPVGKALERCQRYVIEASKQCGRNELLDISEPMTTVDFWKSAEGPMRFIAHPNEAFGTAESTTPDQTITVAIGPEGGFTAEEVQAAIELGWFGLCLGPRVLRVETAAMCAAARFCR
jgi:16S rRNA (uracil1498-N3)-methyltransferase